ncbi:hypothetical protein PINS_up002503 [Pythium insidiosum]|nr:hypothetical protein PINS_up002503 [Pythium insidiosum]
MLESRRRLLNTSLLAILVLSCGLFVATLFLLETPYVGFNAFLTASLHVVYAFGAIVILNKSPSAYSIGILIGASLLILVLSLEGAIYWGLVARDNLNRESASIAASGFHSLIFVIQLAVTWIVVKAKEDVIDTYAAYEYIPDVGYADRPSLSNASPINYQATAPTADI